jgi:sec-independent protein translocase protein TatA
MGDLFAPWHIVILVVAFMVLFGARKLPGAAQSLGQAMRIFKSETKGLTGDHHDDAAPAAVTPPAVVTQPAPAAAPAPAPVVTPSAQQEQIDALQRQLNDLQAKNAAPQAQPSQPS